MSADGVASVVGADAVNTSSTPSADDAQIFAQMVQGILTTGISLGNSIVGDVIDSINSTDDES
jgi:hypothetical protein